MILDTELTYPNICVLIADDDSSILSYICSIMNSLHVKLVVEVINGADCLKEYVIHKPDLVFLDINMPDIDGITILKELVAEHASAYIIVVSGDSTLDNITNSIDNGAKGFIAKPFTGKKFVDAIEKMVTSSE